jgi:hypothetical protein
MTVLTRNGRSVALLDSGAKIASVQDLLDLFVTARYEHGCVGLIVPKESLGEDFFDLKTRVAGEFLQKCSHYRVPFAVVGDFSAYQSRSLRDFIRECNRGSLVFFKGSAEDALEALTRP